MSTKLGNFLLKHLLLILEELFTLKETQSCMKLRLSASEADGKHNHSAVLNEQITLHVQFFAGLSVPI